MPAPPLMQRGKDHAHGLAQRTSQQSPTAPHEDSQTSDTGESDECVSLPRAKFNAMVEETLQLRSEVEQLREQNQAMAAQLLSSTVVPCDFH